MVGLLIGLSPAAVGVLVLLGGLAGSVHPDAPGSPVAILYAGMVLATLVLGGLGCVRRRSASNSAAWVLLLCGVLVYSSGELVEMLLGVPDLTLEDLLRLAAYLPMAGFVVLVRAPLTLVARQRSRMWMVVVGVVLVTAFFVASLVPYFMSGSHAMRGLSQALTAARPVLDVVLLVPLVAVLGVVGPRRESAPYLYAAAGLALLAMSDVFFHYELLTHNVTLEVAGFAAATAALGYFVLASLRRLAPARRAPEA